MNAAFTGRILCATSQLEGYLVTKMHKLTLPVVHWYNNKGECLSRTRGNQRDTQVQVRTGEADPHPSLHLELLVSVDKSWKEE